MVCLVEAKSKARSLYAKGASIRRVASLTGISQPTILKWYADILRSKSEAAKGRAKTDEHRQHLRESACGRVIPQEQRLKISLAHKRRGTVPPSQKNAVPWNFRGITPIHERIRKSSVYAAWRRQIFERDNFTCQVCCERGGRLRSHHIKKFSEYPALRLEPTNGITVCEGCDIEYIFGHEENWEAFFNSNLIARGIVFQ
jgi:hypothetical protein